MDMIMSIIYYIRRYIRNCILRSEYKARIDSALKLHTTYLESGFLEDPIIGNHPYMNDIKSEIRCAERILNLIK